MSDDERKTVGGMAAQLAEMWSALDTLFEGMSPADWQRPHGRDWVFADLPYHLAYVDRLCVARPVELGEELPAAEQIQICTINELNAWNQSNFALRPEGQPVEKSLEQMQASRETIRRIATEMTDADLARPAWFPLLTMRGFRPAQVALGFGVGHTWGHLEEVRLRLGHAGAMVTPEVTHTMLGINIPGISAFLDADRARERDFSFAIEITSLGGGTWRFKAANQGWQVDETKSADTDLVISQDLDTYIKTRFFISDTASLIEAGEIKVSDPEAMAVYDQLSVVPDFDMVFPAAP